MGVYVKMVEMEKLNLKELILPDYNPRQITPEAFESLKRSITEFGYVTPLVVNTVNNHVVGGNQRVKALIELGYEAVECAIVEIHDINEEKALNIRLNNNSGDWDIGKLDNIFNDLELSGFDASLTGFNTDNLQPFAESPTPTEIPTSETITTDLNTGLKTEKNNTTETPEPQTKNPEDNYAGGLTEDDVTVKVGDVYILGNHRLMCGDSSIKENIDILIDNEKIDLLLTDPPYGISIVNTTGKIGGGKPVTIQKTERLEPQVKSDSKRERNRYSGKPRRCASKTV